MLRRPGKNKPLLLAVSILAVMSGLVVYSPTLYRMFCEVTGFGGALRGGETTRPLDTAILNDEITISFDASVAAGLPWDFEPEERRVRIRIGETAQIHYVARNRSQQTIVGRATFNVTPYKAAPYFFKIQCFCFTEQKLAPGESARMPVMLYVDPEMVKDSKTGNVRDITLAYTFFMRNDIEADKVEGVRNLKSGSEELDGKLKKGGVLPFSNDAPAR